jgi:hypothetical protein
VDRLGPTSTLSPPPVEDKSSLFTATSPCSNAADTADAPRKTQELPAANCEPPTTTAPAADLARLAAELQALAEETARLRQGLDRLVTVTEAAPRWPGPLSAGREGDFSRSGCYNRPLGSGTRADEGGVLALWLQQRLLGAVEALLEELRGEGFLLGSAAGALSGSFRHQSSAHGKKARAAAAAQAAQVPHAAQAAAQGDMMELTPRTSWDVEPQACERLPIAETGSPDAGGWTDTGPGAGIDSLAESEGAAAGRDADVLGSWGLDAAVGGTSSHGGSGGHDERFGGSISAGGGVSLAKRPKDSAPGGRRQAFAAKLPFEPADVQPSDANVPPRFSGCQWSVPATPLQLKQTAAPPFCAAVRWYDDPAGPAVLAGGSSHDRGCSSSPTYPCSGWEARETCETAMRSLPAAPHPTQPPAAEPGHGGDAPGEWVDAGLSWPGAGGEARPGLGAASEAERMQTSDARGAAAGGYGLQIGSHGRFLPSSPSSTAGVESLPAEAAAATARYCI